MYYRYKDCNQIIHLIEHKLVLKQILINHIYHHNTQLTPKPH